MTSTTIRNIENKTEELLSDFDMLQAPVKVDKLAKFLGATIEYQDLDDEVSGFLVRKHNKNIIGVNQNHPPVRKRFTISHEIGHLILHLHKQALFVDYYKDKGAKFYRSTNKEYDYRMEKEANQFAASLLMPEPLIEVEIQNLPENLNYSMMMMMLSRKFKVSTQAMDFRLKALGYYDYGF
ncbi:MAG: ImmA/IrrE family metallo-endopeptidase [Aureisphaera sp.]